MNKMITKGKTFDLLTNSLNYVLRKCMEISLENLYGDAGANGVNNKGVVVSG